jgi:hypothetical protein
MIWPKNIALRRALIGVYRLELAFATVCLNVGISVALPADPYAVRNLINRLHPLVTEYPLIRLGQHGDGGYLVPDDLEAVAACFSPGVGAGATFEMGMIERSIPCFLLDGSVDAAPIKGDLVHFTKKYLGVVDDDSTITLDHWVGANMPGNDDLLLQMDIEGGEWPILLNVSRATLRRFRIVIIEFHNLEKLMDKHAFVTIKSTFERLLQDFYVVHNHPNNAGCAVRYRSLNIPRVLEMTFIRKDRVATTKFAQVFPHPLDEPNDPDNFPDLRLPPDWFYHVTP